MDGAGDAIGERRPAPPVSIEDVERIESADVAGVPVPPVSPRPPAPSSMEHLLFEDAAKEDAQNEDAFGIKKLHIASKVIAIVDIGFSTIAIGYAIAVLIFGLILNINSATITGFFKEFTKKGYDVSGLVALVYAVYWIYLGLVAVISVWKWVAAVHLYKAVRSAEMNNPKKASRYANLWLIPNGTIYMAMLISYVSAMLQMMELGFWPPVLHVITVGLILIPGFTIMIVHFYEEKLNMMALAVPVARATQTRNYRVTRV